MNALPRWARVADYLTLLLLAIALTVAASGGFRVRMGDWRIALTSPYRVLIAAAALAVVRHVFARQEPVYRHVPTDIAAWFRSPAFRSAAAALVGTRLAILFIGYLAVVTFGYGRTKVPLRDYNSEILTLPLRFDTGWYLGIATDGYRYDPRAGERGQQNIVFFPAYPILTRVVALLLGNRELSYIAAGTLISFAAFLLALVYLYRFARDELLDDERSTLALWLLAAYPFALFYGAVYTESLYLLGVVAAFYHFSRREFHFAGAWGLLVGLTRPNGFMLAVPIGLLSIQPWLPRRLVRGDRSRDVPRDRRAEPRDLVPALAASAMPVAGMLVYSLFIWSLTGRPFAWAAGHAAWGREYRGLAELVTDRYNFISRAGLRVYVAELP